MWWGRWDVRVGSWGGRSGKGGDAILKTVEGRVEADGVDGENQTWGMRGKGRSVEGMIGGEGGAAFQRRRRRRRRPEAAAVAAGRQHTGI